MRGCQVVTGGIDVGSTLTKVVVVRGGVLVGTAIGRTEIDHVGAARALLRQALSRAGLEEDELAYLVATGYGRKRLAMADREITEISCHARGVKTLFPEVRTIIDIGGQDAKGIKLSAAGKVLKFAMNDKCAAGTGRFLEVAASTLGLTMDELGERSKASTLVVPISSVCTVFAEQEVVQRLADGAALADVLAGLHSAVASRVQRMVRSLGVEAEVVFTGGCARNQALREALQDCLDIPLQTPEQPELTGALGAALLAAEYAEKAEPVDRPRRLQLKTPESVQRAGETHALCVGTGPACDEAREGSFPVPAESGAHDRPIAGVDAGAIFTKAVVVFGSRAYFSVMRSDGHYSAVAEAALTRALRGADVPQKALASIGTTGVGATKSKLGPERNDTSCLAAGLHALFPGAEQGIDVGGHGTRVVRLDGAGGVKSFSATGQCAAGSARILEVIAHLLRVHPSELGPISLRAEQPAAFSAGCSVFAESEAISLLTRGVSIEDLVAGLHQSLAAKIMAIARANMRNGTRAFAGGGARDVGLLSSLHALSEPMLVAPEPMLVGALGAALLAPPLTC